MSEDKLNKEEVLALFKIADFASDHPNLGSIAAAANKDLLKINAMVQKTLDKEAKKEAEEKVAAEAKAKEEANAKAKEEAEAMEASAKKASLAAEKPDETHARRV